MELGEVPGSFIIDFGQLPTSAPAGVMAAMIIISVAEILFIVVLVLVLVLYYGCTCTCACTGTCTCTCTGSTRTWTWICTRIHANTDKTSLKADTEDRGWGKGSTIELTIELTTELAIEVTIELTIE